ncbi:hypothetical protein L210DRAFT_2381527 [Boletus edulis BED1]|uniref:Uncharacterized protein n=1 Tax=Boletus edulis BED1 TaxID=1328754 RepID=A0AAD4C6C7_BOLED|nr:hypothetical protein L210DRAFT_2381527 [Boletus edulis BED1]
MDLSQQELPLTAYFTRGTQEARSRPMTYKKKKRKKKEEEEEEKPAEDSVARCSKRRKSDVQYSTASPPGCFAGQSESRKTILQLPTPATSTRKRKCNGHLEVPAKTRAVAAGTVLSSVEQSAIPQDEEDLSQLEFGPTPSKLPQVSRNGAVPLATPSTDRRRTKSTGIELHPGSRHPNRGETGVNCSPLARSECWSPSNPTPASPRPLDSEVPRALLPHVQHSARPTAGRPSLPVDLDCPDPFYAREKNSSFVRRDGAFAPPKQRSVQSKTLDGQPSDGHALPMIPVPSSQSQYLLHLDATPKRRRYSRHIETTVISSQTQEERELTLSTPRRPTVIVNLPVGVSPGKHTHGNARLGCNKQINQHVYALGSTPLASPINSPVCPSRSPFATKKALDELSLKSSSPSRREKLTSHHSPSRKAKTALRSRHNSIENIPPAHIEESLTESESESDILHMRMNDGLSMLGPPPLGMKPDSTSRASCS